MHHHRQGAQHYGILLPKLFDTAMLEDLDKRGVYTRVHETPKHLYERIMPFWNTEDLSINASCQDMPHYTATVQTHKTLRLQVDL